jgi:tryptophanyl-tRNA synthetase
MAADILLYEADRVPVGSDQSQHVELTRDLAIRFNKTYGETFVVPELAHAALAARVADLQDPSKKMNKSAPDDSPGVVRILDTPDVILRKFKRAVTDSENSVRYDPETKPGVSNLLAILAALVGHTPEDVAEPLSGYSDLKMVTAEAVIAELEPIRRRHDELLSNPDQLSTSLKKGATKALAHSSSVLERAQFAMGIQ